MSDSDSRSKRYGIKNPVSFESILNEALVILQRIVYFHADLVIESLFPVILSGTLCLIFMLLFNNDTIKKLDKLKSFYVISILITTKLLWDLLTTTLLKHNFKKIPIMLVVIQCAVILFGTIGISILLFMLDLSMIHLADIFFLVLIFWNYLLFGILSFSWNTSTKVKQYFLIIFTANLSFVMIKIIHQDMIWIFILISSLVDILGEILPYLRMNYTEVSNQTNIKLTYALVYTTLPLVSSSILYDSSAANTSDNNTLDLYKLNNYTKMMDKSINFASNNMNSLKVATSGLTQSVNKRITKKLRSYGLKQIKIMQNKCIRKIRTGVQISVSSLLIHDLLFASVGATANILAIYFCYLCTFLCFFIKTNALIHLEIPFPIQFPTLFLVYTITACVTEFVRSHNEQNFLNDIYP